MKHTLDNLLISFNCLFICVDGPISYSMPDGAFGGRYGDLIDDTYDGVRDSRKYFYGGLGQLTDGIRGHENYKVNSGYEWIGWEAANDTIEIVFEFENLRNFTSADVHTHNAFTKHIEVFSLAKIYFSYDRNRWSKNPLEIPYSSDHVGEKPRNVIINLGNKVAKYVKISLKFASKLLLISEIKFNSLPVNSDYHLNLDNLESLDSNKYVPLQHQVDGYDSTVLIAIIVCALLLLTCVALYMAYIRWYKHGKGGSCSDHHFYPVDINYLDSTGATLTNSTTKVTTPVYCEPDELSSQSGVGSNHRLNPNNYLIQQHQGSHVITCFDHEYAVPDVIYQNGCGNKAKRLISNPLANLEKLVNCNSSSKKDANNYLLDKLTNGVTSDGHDLKPITENHQKINVMSGTTISGQNILTLNNGALLTPKFGDQRSSTFHPNNKIHSTPSHRHNQLLFNHHHVATSEESDIDDDNHSSPHHLLNNKTSSHHQQQQQPQHHHIHSNQHVESPTTILEKNHIYSLKSNSVSNSPKFGALIDNSSSQRLLVNGINTNNKKPTGQFRAANIANTNNRRAH